MVDTFFTFEGISLYFSTLLVYCLPMLGIGFSINECSRERPPAAGFLISKPSSRDKASSNMIRLESYGDSLKKDDYQCHSRFRRVVNFYNGSSMVALVDRTIGPGPHHVIVSGLDVQPVERLAITSDEILLDGNRLLFASSCRYDSRIDLNGAIDRNRFSANLHCFEHCLRQATVPKSLAFLLGQKDKRSPRSTLERSIATRLRAGSKLIYGADFLAGIHMFRGVGFGLTPGGDDFIGGLLLALHGGQKIFGQDFSQTIRSVRRQASGKNPFSNTMLAQASEGRAIGKIKDLLDALIRGEEKNIRRCSKQLRTIGHSSGVDFGVGLLLTFKMLIRTKGEKWW